MTEPAKATKARLDREKLELEIAALRRPHWFQLLTSGPFAAIVVALIGLAGGWLSGWFSTERHQLQVSVEALKKEQVEIAGSVAELRAKAIEISAGSVNVALGVNLDAICKEKRIAIAFNSNIFPDKSSDLSLMVLNSSISAILNSSYELDENTLDEVGKLSEIADDLSSGKMDELISYINEFGRSEFAFDHYTVDGASRFLLSMEQIKSFSPESSTKIDPADVSLACEVDLNSDEATSARERMASVAGNIRTAVAIALAALQVASDKVGAFDQVPPVDKTE